MPTLLRSRFYRVASLFAFVITPSCAIWGLLLSLNAFMERGSLIGDVLVGGAGFLFLPISPVLFIFGVTAYRISNQSNRPK